MRIPSDRIYTIVQSMRGIKTDTAMRLGNALKVSPELWLSFQSKYELEMARIKSEELV
jgi:addiction module HigA family antidote